MVVTACGYESSAVSIALRQLKAEHSAVEAESPFQFSHL
jgi:hypothetical protein